MSSLEQVFERRAAPGEHIMLRVNRLPANIFSLVIEDKYLIRAALCVGGHYAQFEVEAHSQMDLVGLVSALRMLAKRGGYEIQVENATDVDLEPSR